MGVNVGEIWAFWFDTHADYIISSNIRKTTFIESHEPWVVLNVKKLPNSKLLIDLLYDNKKYFGVLIKEIELYRMWPEDE